MLDFAGIVQLIAGHICKERLQGSAEGKSDRGKDDTTFFCTSQNISASGLLMVADRSMGIGEQLSCSFYLPGSTQITADGEVARTERMTDGKHQYGIRFTGISPAQKSDIETFMAETLKNFK